MKTGSLNTSNTCNNVPASSSDILEVHKGSRGNQYTCFGRLLFIEECKLSWALDIVLEFNIFYLQNFLTVKQGDQCGVHIENVSLLADKYGSTLLFGALQVNVNKLRPMFMYFLFSFYPHIFSWLMVNLKLLGSQALPRLFWGCLIAPF